MQPTTPLPTSGEVFLDARGGGRALRVSWHPEAGVVVLSLWRGSTCTGTFRMAVEDVPVMVDLLRESLQAAYDEAPGAFAPGLRPVGRHRADASRLDVHRAGGTAV